MSTVDLTGIRWLKSSFSGGDGGGNDNCVEVALACAHWRKSSRSSGQGGSCVEVAGLASAVAVRDSKEPDGPKLAFTHANWKVFLNGVKTG